MARRVLVTRPEPGATRTARRLAELGFEPVKLPLTETVTLAVDAAFQASTVNAVAVTSANALRHAPPALIAALAAKRCFAVGRKTAVLAVELGFGAVEEGPGDAAGLAGRVADRLGPGAAVAYLCGRVRLSGFEARLADAGIPVRIVETYDTRAVDYDPGRLSALVGAEPIDAALLYSAKAAERFSGLAWPKPVRRLLAGTACLCMSRRVAESLAGVGASQILVAAEPSEAALLRLLDR